MKAETEERKQPLLCSPLAAEKLTVVVADVDVAAATAVAETANKQEQRRAPSFLTVT